MFRRNFGFILFLILVISFPAEAALNSRGRFAGRSWPRENMSYFGFGGLVLDYDDESAPSDISSTSGMQFVGGLQWDYFGLEARLTPGYILGGTSNFKFEFDGDGEETKVEFDHRLSILGKASWPVALWNDNFLRLYGMGGVAFGDVKTETGDGSSTETSEESETDLLYGAGLAFGRKKIMFQLDWLANITDNDYEYSGVYFGIHYIFN
jgi:opacity protein-like surface antigen